MKHFRLLNLIMNFNTNEKTIKHYNTRVISIIVFYDNRKLLVFKLLVVVVYWFLFKYFYAEYLCIKKDQKLSLPHKGFDDTSFDEVSVIVIPDIFGNKCAFLWFCSRIHFNTNFYMQKQVSVVLPIEIFFMVAHYSQVL